MDELAEKSLHAHEPLEPRVGSLLEAELGRLFNREPGDIRCFRNNSDATEAVTGMLFERGLRQSREYGDMITKSRRPQ